MEVHPSPPLPSARLTFTCNIVLLPAYYMHAKESLGMAADPQNDVVPRFCYVRVLHTILFFGLLYIFFVLLRMCGRGNPASQHRHPSAMLWSVVQCRLALCFLLSLFPLSASSHVQTCTWFNLLLGICTGIGARRCVASSGKSIFVTILQIRTVVSRQGSVCSLSLDLSKLVLNFQPAFSEVAHAREFRYTVKWCLVSCGEAVFQGEWFS